ncbi:MAG TPA: ATP-binding cassette domain-containing protein [Actinopolymorphaceae bacterium]|jgi:ABC-type sugar transport system ATPase subunit
MAEHTSGRDHSRAAGRPVLAARKVSKRYGHVQALVDADIELFAGEVVALVGDNGAGKSTLTKVLCGAIAPDAGEVQVDGQTVRFASPRAAKQHGVAVVYQDLALVDSRDVAHNVFLGDVPVRGLTVDRRRMYREARAALDALRIDIPSLHTPVGALSGGQRQAIAIARAVREGGRVVIMDEPTAALGVQEQRKVLRLIQDLSTAGKAVLVISHNLEHVFGVADRIVVMRSGRVAGTRRKADTTPEEIVRLIVGAAELQPAEG